MRSGRANRVRQGQTSAAGSSIFTDADGYQASLQDILDLLVICPRGFHARLTWVELPHVQLMRAEESSARTAYLRPPPEQVPSWAAYVQALGPTLAAPSSPADARRRSESEYRLGWNAYQQTAPLGAGTVAGITEGPFGVSAAVGASPSHESSVLGRLQ